MCVAHCHRYEYYVELPDRYFPFFSLESQTHSFPDYATLPNIGACDIFTYKDTLLPVEVSSFSCCSLLDRELYLIFKLSFFQLIRGNDQVPKSKKNV